MKHAMEERTYRNARSHTQQGVKTFVGAIDDTEDKRPTALHEAVYKDKEMWGGHKYLRRQSNSQYEEYHTGTMGYGHYPMYATIALPVYGAPGPYGMMAPDMGPR